MAKSSVLAECRAEPGVEQALAVIDLATKSARAECARLAEQRKILLAEIGELKAELSEERRKLTELLGLSGAEFLKRCVKGGVDKHTIEDLRAQLRSALADIDEAHSQAKVA